MSDEPLNDPERLLLAQFPALRDMVTRERWGQSTERAELLRLVRLVTGTMVRRDGSAPYAAAQVTMMDREDGVMKAVVYPVNRVELLNIFNDRMPERFRAFRVTEEGWQEEQ